MDKFKDIAYIRSEAAKTSLPDVTESGIEGTAWLVWLAAHVGVPANAPEVKHGSSGQPGHMWEGSQRKLINELWPALSGGYTVDAEYAETLRRLINGYLWSSGNMINRRKGGRSISSVWWISKHFSPLKTTKSVEFSNKEEESTVAKTTEPVGNPFSFVDAVAAISDKPKETLAKQFPCRDTSCPEWFEYQQIRASHEKREHGFRVMADGSVVKAVEPTLDEVRDLVRTVADGLDAPQTGNYFSLKVRALNPGVSKKQVMDALFSLLNDPNETLCEAGSSEHITRYANTELAAKIYRSSSDNPFTKHMENVEALLEDLRNLADQATILELQEKLQTVTAERDRYKQERDDVTRERDELIQRLEVLVGSFGKGAK